MLIHGGDERIAQLLKLPVGERTDQFLYLLLEPWFLGYWTFSRPREKGIELADVLAWYGDVVMLFEAKTRAEGASDLTWAKSRLVDAIETIDNRAAMLREGRVSTLRNKWRGEVRWDPAVVKDYYGVVVLNHISDAYDPRELAPEAFKACSVPIQVFSLLDLAELLRFVNTIYDFIVYYELRHAFARTRRVQVHEEWQAYQGVLAEHVELAAEQNVPRSNAKNSQRFQASITRAVLRSTNARESDYRRLAAGYLLDLVLNSVVQRATMDDSGRRVGGREHDHFVRAIGALAEMSRQRRSAWGKVWLDVAQSARRNRATTHRDGRSPSRNRSYLFSACLEEGDERGQLIGRVGKLVHDRNGADTTLCVAANPLRILWTFDAYRRWMKGDHKADLPPKRVLDATVAFIENAESIKTNGPKSPGTA